MLRCPARVQWYQPRQGYSTDVVQELGVCRAMATHVHRRFYTSPGGVATQKTGKLSRLICSH